MKQSSAMAGGVLAAILAVATVGVAGAREDGPPAAPAASNVCTVNVGKVFGIRARDFQDKLQADLDALKASMGQREAELRKLAQDVETRLSAGTPEYELERKKIEMRIAELQYDQKAGAEDLRRKQVTRMGGIYREITGEAERIAKEKGYKAVLAVDDEPIMVEERGQVIGVNDLKLQMALRTVLWADASVDITKDVIEALGK